MKILELFSGTESFSKEALKRGHEVITIDNDKRFNPTYCIDILSIDPDWIHDKIGYIDVIWASPPCTTFSVASISTHWKGGKGAFIPKTEQAKLGLRLLEHTIYLIKNLKPKYWIIENPRGVMRKVIDCPFKPITVTYCQYGDKRMKPTDLWMNFEFKGKRCKNGMTCHESAPRGSKTGTQGLKGAKERGVIPPRLCQEILKVIETKEQEE